MNENPIIRYAQMHDGETFDEFIATDATVHIEAMGPASWWIGVTVDDRMWHINLGAENVRAKSFAVCEEMSR